MRNEDGPTTTPYGRGSLAVTSRDHREWSASNETADRLGRTQPPKTIRPNCSPSRFTSSGSVAARNRSPRSKNFSSFRFSRLAFMFTSMPHCVGHNRTMADRKTFLEQERPAEFFSRWTSADSIAAEHAAVSRLREVQWARPLLNNLEQAERSGDRHQRRAYISWKRASQRHLFS